MRAATSDFLRLLVALCVDLLAYGLLIHAIGRHGSWGVDRWAETAVAATLVGAALIFTRRSLHRHTPLFRLDHLRVGVRRMLAVVTAMLAAGDGAVVTIAVLSGKGHSAVFWGTIILLLAILASLVRAASVLSRSI
jgi:hypothetical protein